MADTKPPASERFSPCGHLGSGGAIADDDDDLGVPIFHLSKSLTDVATDPRDGEEAARCRPDLRKSASSAVCPQEAPETPWTPELAYRGVAGTPPLGSAPMSTAAANHLRPCKGRGLVPGGHLPQTASSSRDLRGERQDQALQRSHSVCLHAAREARSRGLGSCSEAGLTCSGTGCRFRRVPGCYSLGCRQAASALHADAMPPCMGGSYWSPTAPRGGVWICTPSPNNSPRDSRRHICRAAFVGNAASDQGPELPCHPTPSAVDAGSGGEAALPHGMTLSFPRLTASVSDTRLDSRHHVAARCCGVASPSASAVRRSTEGGRTSREAATMTSRLELRDAGVQTGPPESPSLHVFPKVSLAGEDGEAGVAEEGPGAGQTSPVKEVLWDAEGMTWEVYGAAVDPQELGVAIQRHLELQIKEVAASRALKLSQRDAGRSQHGGHRKKKSMIALLRKPICCIRPRTTGD
ncbi:G protein-regulated inducer of neurite outgrowth 2 [Anguilla rostrata]|uniref:G protein-regulated inducer of neurite outgrowth 2 n=1 Tax=Anguilla rostrata TaxID=7938 RepID=UPI0030CD3729